MEEKLVSVILPVYNEEKYIDRCLNSLVNQTFDIIGNSELIILDGGSTDETLRHIKAYEEKLPIRLLSNEKRQVTYALNKGIEDAKGKYIIRIDAHSEYDEKYIEKCIHYLETVDAENVGGVAETCAVGFVGEVNAQILSSRFGVGNSNFRTSDKSGYTDTVPFGAFRREIFDKIGVFDVELPRSEDNDFNSRIRKNGGKVYMACDIKFKYYCRDTVLGLLDQAIKNGNALFLTIRKNPSAMSLRHYIPFLFVLSLIILPALSFIKFFRWVFFAEMILYFLLDIVFSFFSGKLKYSFLKFVLYPIFHISYGVGSFIGMLGIKLY